MKIAIVHDYIKEYGGAERVLESLHNVFPQAPVYTSVYLPQFLGPHRKRFEGWDIRTTFLENIPFRHKLMSPLRLLSVSAFSNLDLSSYDVIITSATGAYFPNLVHKGSAKLVSYCHTPPRYLYGFATARQWKKAIVGRVIGESVNIYLKAIDARAAENVDFFIANSNEVASRIQKFYKRSAIVIYPPVDVNSEYRIENTEQKKNSNFKIHNPKFYLAGGRLARPKHIDLAIRACNQLSVPLVVFGKGFAGYGEQLKKIAGPTIQFVGEVTDEKKCKLMRQAKAFIFPAEDEDFGITPVEAMAVGIPVIAFRSGGVIESVLDGKTGVFFDELNEESLMSAIKKIDGLKILSEDCKKQAEKFSRKRFEKQIGEYIEKIVNGSK